MKAPDPTKNPKNPRKLPYTHPVTPGVTKPLQEINRRLQEKNKKGR